MHTFKISSCCLFSQTMHAFVLVVDYIGSSLAPLLRNLLLQKLRMSNSFFHDSSQGSFITRCWMFIQPNQPTEETATVTSRARFADAAQNSHSSGRSGSGSNGNNRQQWQTMSRSKAAAARMQTLTSQEKTPKVKARELSTQNRHEKVARATVLAVSTATTLRGTRLELEQNEQRMQNDRNYEKHHDNNYYMIDQLIINALLIIFILHPSPLMIIAVD